MEIMLEIYFKDNLKDSIVDMLLEDGFDDFYYHQASKYASTLMLQSPQEQVFKIYLYEDRAKFLANKLLQAFGTNDMRIFKSHLEIYNLDS